MEDKQKISDFPEGGAPLSGMIPARNHSLNIKQRNMSQSIPKLDFSMTD